MKKTTSIFNIIILFCIIFAISILSEVKGIQSQSASFLYLGGVIVFFTTMRMALEILLQSDKGTEVKQILMILVVYFSIIFTTIFVEKLLNIKMEFSLQIITFGIVLGVIGTVLHVFERISFQKRYKKII